jgi:hypothetical protein
LAIPQADRGLRKWFKSPAQRLGTATELPAVCNRESLRGSEDHVL